MYQNYFNLENTNHRFEVIRLWEVPSTELLEYKGLYPLVTLGKSDNPLETLKQVAQKIEAISLTQERSNVAAATSVLAGLVLDKTIIRGLLREEIMKESVIYQDIKAQGEAEGLAKGRLEGEAEGKTKEALILILRLLNRKFQSITPEIEQRIQSLTLTQLEDLGEALLDFQQKADLISWLSNR
ncbi:DUF4351 domain-containing protein [Gloeocapsa sp. PCC 73106]|uniref:DUF4351 domain-containing protein n=1 Tax=Gloeocapsa sp. PCC 73106 TaxID=102232 RepID=UPI0002ACCC81|nr:DUF4351 domain-containing protein [Gloeocapsa sp. PCC 73106]ELR96935.1 hypothetical protein GLO73106DRAFT_00007360 [Gloeocapsa sp. PCC 73106]